MVPFHRLVEHLRGDAVEVGEIDVEHYLVTTDEVDAALDTRDWDERPVQCHTEERRAQETAGYNDQSGSTSLHYALHPPNSEATAARSFPSATSASRRSVSW